MKYIAGGVLMILVITAYMSVSVQEAYAFGISHPFGGLITIQTTGVSCSTGSGPFSLGSSGKSVSSTTPYFFPLGKTSSPTVKEWVLGRYEETPDTTDCKQGDDPYPVYKVTLFGHSGAGGAGGIAAGVAGSLLGGIPDTGGTTGTGATSGGTTADAGGSLGGDSPIGGGASLGGTSSLGGSN